MSTSTEPLATIQPTATPAPAAPTTDKTAETEATAKEADAALKACVRSFRKGEQGAKDGRLESGKHAEKYLALRMALGHSRESSVTVLSAALAQYASADMDYDVNLLIAVYHSHRLLVVKDEKGEDSRGELPYGHYVNAFRKLVTRTEKATPDESWVLLPGMEKDCIDLFREAITQSFNRKDCKSKCDALVNVFTLKQAELRDTAAREAAHKASSAREAANTAAKDAEKAPEADKLAAQKVAAELNKLANDAEQASKRAKTAANTARNRADKVNKKPEPQADNDKPNNGPAPAHNPLVAAKQATAKDLASSLIAQIDANPAPDDVLYQLFKALDLRVKHAQMIGKAITSNPSKHALEFAYDLAGFLLDNLPEQQTATPSKKVA